MMTALTQALTLWPTAEPDIPLPAMLAWDDASPCEVRLSFMSLSLQHTFEYVLDRNILADVLIATYGQTIGTGTVQARQGEHVDHVVLRLWQDDFGGGGEWWELYADAERVEEFVRDVYRLVPMGAERELLAAQVDDALVAILAEVA